MWLTLYFVQRERSLGESEQTLSGSTYVRCLKYGNCKRQKAAWWPFGDRRQVQFCNRKRAQERGRAAAAHRVAG